MTRNLTKTLEKQLNEMYEGKMTFSVGYDFAGGIEIRLLGGVYDLRKWNGWSINEVDEILGDDYMVMFAGFQSAVESLKTTYGHDFKKYSFSVGGRDADGILVDYEYIGEDHITMFQVDEIYAKLTEHFGSQLDFNYTLSGHHTLYVAITGSDFDLSGLDVNGVTWVTNAVCPQVDVDMDKLDKDYEFYWVFAAIDTIIKDTTDARFNYYIRVTNAAKNEQVEKNKKQVESSKMATANYGQFWKGRVVFYNPDCGIFGHKISADMPGHVIGFERRDDIDVVKVQFSDDVVRLCQPQNLRTE